MPSTHSQIYLHIVFSTKNRRPYLNKPLADEVYPYLSSTTNSLGYQCIITGGWLDHVHMLVKQKPNISVSDFVRDLKSGSARFINDLHRAIQKFGWQEGYGAFSVSPRSCDQVIGYIQNQEVHHSKIGFESEYVQMLEMAGIEYNPKYLWD